MVDKISAVKGMNDVLPGEIGRWHRIESAYRTAMERLGYREDALAGELITDAKPQLLDFLGK